ncbi:pentapeptide repeat-containing protein [Aliarcobacter butzleri]|uniref:pentapeptide repeat-containing protein n=1 Tax=Aliarcobacter butzleri TaxID=28197 RepID=UPI0024DEE0BF|nr:pentapeptide repeat-containing protein [Aliarcobacter butzleri]MDK2065332.1 pentapeptide repeat-containing protein [Aliarcobacter butzleri]
MTDCQNCTDDKKCILHIEKSDYQTDFHKVGFLNEFYEGLFNYVVDFEEIRDFLIEKSKVIYSEENAKYSELLGLLEHKKEFIKIYFSEDDSLEKLEVEKEEEFKSVLDEFFKEKEIIFNNIIFPAYKSRDKFNYMRIIKKLKKIHFNCCKFSATFLELKNIEVFFENCEFLDSYSISNSDILEKESNVIYQMCIFHRDVVISKNDKEYKINHTLFSDCIFKKDLKAEKIEFEKGIFNNTKYDKTFINKKYLEINKLEIKKCIVKNNFIFRGYTVNEIDLTDTVFEQDVKAKIQFCDIKEAIFYNTKFKDLADFYQSKFMKVNFERTDFEKISVFSECEFYCDVDFKYTKFLGIAIFRDTVISRKLDLRNSIFDDEANFLDITSKKRKKVEEQFIGEPTEIKVANRETARIIKNFYDNSNNIIEANRFYKLEMEKREKELNLKNNFFEWIIFKFHKISSNHSQDWVLVLLWILNISYLYYFVKKNTYYYLDEFLAFILLLGVCILIYSLINFRNYFGKIILIFSFLLFMSYFSIDINEITNLINPFSIMTKGEILFLGLMIYKVIIAYLIYQLIISIRQNTRRK